MSFTELLMMNFSLKLAGITCKNCNLHERPLSMGADIQECTPDNPGNTMAGDKSLSESSALNGSVDFVFS